MNVAKARRSHERTGTSVASAATNIIAILALVYSFACPSPSRSEWWTFEPRDGFSGTVREAFEVRSGEIWFALTNGSTSAYDGVGFRSVNEIFPPAEIFALTEDSAGRRWIIRARDWATASLGQHGTWQWQTGPLAGGFESETVTCGTADLAGKLWFGTAGGVGCFDRTTWKRYTVADGLADNNIVRICADASGNIWVTTLYGISRFDGDVWTTFAPPPGIQTSSVLCTAVDRTGNFWIGTADNGAYRFDGTAWTTYAAADGLPGSVYTICPDRRGAIWLGTSLGVRRFNGQTFLPVDLALAGVAVKIFEDRLGALWFGTDYYGLARYDGVEWEAHPSPTFTVMTADHSGNIWCGAPGAGAHRFDGATWTVFGTADGLAADDVFGIAPSRTGDVWFATLGGASRFDGTTWTTYTVANGLASDSIYAVAEDDDGDMWVGTRRGVSRFDGVSWRTYTTTDGILGEKIVAIANDRQGGLLLGSERGVTRFDGTTFTALPPVEYAACCHDTPVQSIAVDKTGAVTVIRPNGFVYMPSGPSWFAVALDATSLLEDRGGNLWIATRNAGVYRVDQAGSIIEIYYADLYPSMARTFLHLTAGSGLLGNRIYAIASDDQGDLWFACDGGIVRHHPDRVAPRPAFLSRPISPSTSRDASAAFRAVAGETRGILFSTRFDGSPWSGWGTADAWTKSGILDGHHTLELRARDDYGNVDTLFAAARFEVDATPPTAVITSPAYGSSVRGVIPIYGNTVDPRFYWYEVDVRPVGARSWGFPDARHLALSTTLVAGGLLATWDASKVADGPYEIQLSVTDSLALWGRAVVTVIVDNHAPYLGETAPVTVTSSGGDVYTTNAETHLYFPPHAFARDAVVTIAPAGPGGAPASLPSGGAAKVSDGYDLAWGEALQKPARFSMSYAGTGSQGGTLSLYRSTDNVNWERVGGTLDDQAHSISAAVTGPGRYALYVDDGRGDGSPLSTIAFTPRVLSPSGALADREVGISFRLGKPAPVTIKVFSKSGRLIREVASGLQLNAGNNLIRWNGTDRNGGYVADGLYLVTVEALGQTQTKTLAVVK